MRHGVCVCNNRTIRTSGATAVWSVKKKDRRNSAICVPSLRMIVFFTDETAKSTEFTHTAYFLKIVFFTDETYDIEMVANYYHSVIW